MHLSRTRLGLRALLLLLGAGLMFWRAAVAWREGGGAALPGVLALVQALMGVLALGAAALAVRALRPRPRRHTLHLRGPGGPAPAPRTQPGPPGSPPPEAT